MDMESPHLNLEAPKQNVFVTQLAGGGYDDEDDDIRKFAVVRETADELLRTGINTLQKTSLLRKAVQVGHIDQELKEKREQFRVRMANNKKREEDLRKRSEALKERMSKFDKFLKENEAKRTRALKKYQQEVKENLKSEKQLQVMKNDLQKNVDAKDAVVQKLDKYRKYEQYLQSVIDVLPEDYLEMSAENMIYSVIQRYEGLAATHQGLVERNGAIAKSIEDGNRELDSLKNEMDQQKLVSNQEMTDMQAQHERLAIKISQLETKAGDTKSSTRKYMEELGRITMSIDNLSHMCQAKHWPPMSEMSYIEKLDRITQTFQERIFVWKNLQQLAHQAALNDNSSVSDRPKQVNFGTTPINDRASDIHLPPIDQGSTRRKTKKAPGSLYKDSALTTISENI